MELRPPRAAALIRWALPLALAIALPAQDSRFTAESQLVLVPANVADGRGRPVEGLEPDDFLVLDNGRRRKATVDTIGTGIAPVALVVAVQSAGLSRAALEKVQSVAGMIQPLVTGERGRAAVVSFSDEVTWLQDFTNDPQAIERAFQKIRPGQYKTARMLDALSAAAERLGREPNARRVLLLISESRDRGSETALETVAAEVVSAGVAVYSASYSAFWTAFTSDAPAAPPPPPMRPEHPNDARPVTSAERNTPPPTPLEHRVDFLGALRELTRKHEVDVGKSLSRATGGRTFSFARRKGLDDVVRKLGEELHSQYLLSFAPEGAEPGFHAIEVRVRRKDRPVAVRARPGYWVETAGGELSFR